jgi:hypothetical protein
VGLLADEFFVKPLLSDITRFFAPAEINADREIQNRPSDRFVIPE